MPNEAFCLPGNTSVQEALERQDDGFLPRGWIDGLTLSNDGTDATNDIGVAAGCCRSTVNAAHDHNGGPSTLARHQRDLELPVSIIKQLDVAWAPDNFDPSGFSGGDRSGGRSASSLSNTTWHVFAIGGARVKTDILLHDSVTQSSVLSALPGGYTAYRHIMSIIRTGGAIKPFTQYGDEVAWTTPTLDVNNASAGTSANTGTLTVPLGLAVLARINAYHNSGSGFYVSALTQADLGPTTTAAPLTNAFAGTQASATWMSVMTDTSAQIRYRGSASGAFNIATLGFVHPRGRNG